MAFDALFDGIHGIMDLLNMLGSFVRKAMRGKRTTLFREWRYRNNTLLGIAVILAPIAIACVIWMFIAI